VLEADWTGIALKGGLRRFGIWQLQILDQDLIYHYDIYLPWGSQSQATTPRQTGPRRLWIDGDD